MKILVLKLDLHDEKEMRKAMSKVSSISGVTSVAKDMKEKKMTVKGDVDAVKVASKLRKLCHAEILTFGEDKKDEGGKNEGGGGDKIVAPYWFYNPPIYSPMVSVEENPSGCVIC